MHSRFQQEASALLASEPAFVFFPLCVHGTESHLNKTRFAALRGMSRSRSRCFRAQHQSGGFEANEIRCKTSALLAFYETGRCPQRPGFNVLCCLKMPRPWGLCAGESSRAGSWSAGASQLSRSVHDERSEMTSSQDSLPFRLRVLRNRSSPAAQGI